MQTSKQSVRAEVSHRLASGANAWLKLSKLHVWDDDCISRGIKCTLHKVFVQSTLLYASETWAFPKQQVHRLEVFQMKCQMKICKISLKDKIRNDCISGPSLAGLVRCCESRKRCQPQEAQMAWPSGQDA